jgi:NAD(P)H-dependent FMN reductase
VKVLAITGSMNPQSKTKLATDIVVKAVEAEGIAVEHIHLAHYPLPVYTPDESSWSTAVYTLIEKFDQADAFILSSPEYHGSLTGALKNALDYIEGRNMKGKLVAILGTAGGAMGATNTVNTLHQICRNLHGWPLPSSPTVPRAYEAFDGSGQLKDKKLKDRLETLGKTLAHELKKQNSVQGSGALNR